MSDTGSSEGPFIPTGPSPEKMPPVLGTPSFTLVVGRHQTPQDMENFKEALVEARGQNKMPVAILEGIGMGDSRRIEGILNQLSQGNISVDKALGQISGAGTQGKPTQYLESVCRVLANMQCPVVICDISMEELGRIVPAEENLLNTMSPSFVADTESLEDWTNSIKQAFLTQAQGVGQREAEIMASVLRAVQRY